MDKLIQKLQEKPLTKEQYYRQVINVMYTHCLEKEQPISREIMQKVFKLTKYDIKEMEREGLIVKEYFVLKAQRDKHEKYIRVKCYEAVKAKHPDYDDDKIRPIVEATMQKARISVPWRVAYFPQDYQIRLQQKRDAMKEADRMTAEQREKTWQRINESWKKTSFFVKTWAWILKQCKKHDKANSVYRAAIKKQMGEKTVNELPSTMPLVY